MITAEAKTRPNVPLLSRMNANNVTKGNTTATTRRRSIRRASVTLSATSSQILISRRRGRLRFKANCQADRLQVLSEIIATLRSPVGPHAIHAVY